MEMSGQLRAKIKLISFISYSKKVDEIGVVVTM
jgi:hypothetical protein